MPKAKLFGTLLFRVSFLIIGIAVSKPSFAQDTSPASGREACPEWLNNSDIPECPASGQMLPETYPPAVVVISDASPFWGRSGELLSNAAFTRSVVKSIVRLAEADKPPMILLAVSERTFKSALAMIDGMQIPQDLKDKYKKFCFRHIG